MKLWKTKQLKRLAKALVSIDSEKDMLAFLRDAATLKELESIAGRLEAARMIAAGTPYREIAKETGLSTATITRVAHWMRNGEGGYSIILEKN